MSNFLFNVRGRLLSDRFASCRDYFASWPVTIDVITVMGRKRSAEKMAKRMERGVAGGYTADVAAKRRHASQAAELAARNAMLQAEKEQLQRDRASLRSREADVSITTITCFVHAGGCQG